MALVIDPRLLRSIEEIALASIPEECCGLLLGTVDGGRHLVERIVPAANVWPGDRRCRYEMDARVSFEAFREAARTGGAVVGFYHSHPDGSERPSVHDVEAAWPDKSYLIVAVSDRRLVSVGSWRLPHGDTAMAPEPID